jgi:hypothetical protein
VPRKQKRNSQVLVLAFHSPPGKQTDVLHHKSKRSEANQKHTHCTISKKVAFSSEGPPTVQVKVERRAQSAVPKPCSVTPVPECIILPLFTVQSPPV